LLKYVTFSLRCSSLWDIFSYVRHDAIYQTVNQTSIFTTETINWTHSCWCIALKKISSVVKSSSWYLLSGPTNYESTFITNFKLRIFIWLQMRNGHVVNKYFNNFSIQFKFILRMSLNIKSFLVLINIISSTIK